jgi:hypothetical protein
MTFGEYYKYYLSLHQNFWCRRLHVIGQLFTIAYMMGMVYNKEWLFLLGAPFVVYPFAWSGHFFFEKNTPAAFTKPLWAKACDWIMLRDILVGKIKW